MFKKFDLVWPQGGSSKIYVILSDEIEVPCFDDFAGSMGSVSRFDVTDPKEWGYTFSGHIAYCLIKGEYEIIDSRCFELIPIKSGLGYIPFDQATGKMRELLGLLNISEKMSGCSKNEMVKELARAMLEYAERE